MTGRRLAALFLKDLFEHGLVLAAVTAFLALGWLVLALAALGAPTTVTYLETHAGFMRLAIPALGLALGNRLVVAEMQGRTQRFLESLPLRRWEPLAVKWVFGLWVLLAISFASLVFSIAMALFREPVTVWFATILAARTAAAVISGWSFFFAMGLFGKLRVPLYILMVLGLVVVASTTSLELMRFGTFALLGPDLPLERDEMPWAPIGEALAMAGLYLAIGGTVAFIREGSVEERLSKPMSQRDLAMAGAASLSVMIALGELTPEPEPAPYALPADHVLYAADLPIAVSYLDDDAEEDARALLGRLEVDVGTLAETAGWTRLPQLRVVLRRSLDGSTFEPVTLARNDGVLLRANFLTDASPDLEGLSAELLGALFDARTGGRARLEPRRWARDGLALHWALQTSSLGPRRERGALALWATRERGPDEARMARFEVLRESSGARTATALAATGIDALGDAGGPRAVATLLRTAFPSDATDDFRVVLRDLLHPLTSRIAEAGVTPEALAAAWGARLDRLRGDSTVTSRLDDALGATASCTFERDPSGIVTLVVRAELGPRPRAELRTVTVRHFAIGPFDEVVEDHEMASESVVEDGTGVAEIRIAGRYASHDQVLVRVDLEGMVFRGPLRLLAARREVP